MTDRPTMLGLYPVERELGRGGMGVVYLARDPRLDRPVAIKVLPDEFARDPERLARFEREARLLASLSHPNIASIFGVEEVDGHRLLILEYIPGDTLATLTARGPLPLDEALDVCRQIALAIEAAHEGGVIHRDLKPGNVKITPDGQVKVLDFGLAKGGVGTASGSGPDLSQSPTITYAATGAGVILGTAAYMSPEQARGKTVDKRTDIWSFGCVLFECLTGRLSFGGETVSDTIAKILEREPDWSALPAQTPATVRELLRRCLEKDAKKRQRDIGDVRLELEAAIAARSTATRMAAASTEARTRAALSPRVITIAALALLVGAAAGMGLWSAFGPGARGGHGASHGLVRLSMVVPATIRAIYASLSADGRTFTVLGYPRRPDGTEEPRARLYTRALDDDQFKPIPGTEGAQAYHYSADGRSLLFNGTISEESSQRRLARVPIDGSSPPVTLCDWNEAWSRAIACLENGDILIVEIGGTQVFRVPAAGGAPKPAMKIDTGSATGFFYFVNGFPGGRNALIGEVSWGARGYQQNVWLVDLKTGKASLLVENAGNPVYSPTGHLIFARGDAIMAIPFDLGSLKVTGGPIALMNGVRTPNSWDNADFELSKSGDLVYAPGGRVGGKRRLVVADGTGNVAAFTSDLRAYEGVVSISSDGKQAAVVLPNVRGTYEIWVAEVGRSGLRRTVAMPTADCTDPRWSPDGRWLAFTRQGKDQDDGIWIQRVDGSAPPHPILKTASQEYYMTPDGWAPDGSGLLVDVLNAGRSNVLLVRLSASGDTTGHRTVLGTPASEYGARFSPNGRLLAFISDESGRNEVYVATWSAEGTLGVPLVVSNGGGTALRWSPDGGRLYYDNDAGQLMSVTVTSTLPITASTPAPALDIKKVRMVRPGFEPLPGGRVVFVQKGEEEDDITQFNVVLGWTDWLRARMQQSQAAGR